MSSNSSFLKDHFGQSGIVLIDMREATVAEIDANPHGYPNKKHSQNYYMLSQQSHHKICDIFRGKLLNILK